jgi:hypothetical protein
MLLILSFPGRVKKGVCMNRSLYNKQKASKTLTLDAAADGTSVSGPRCLIHAAAATLNLFILAAVLMCTAAGCAPKARPFTIGVIPDWQNLTYTGKESAERMKDIARFFVDRKQDLNVVFVTSVGDMTEGQFNSAKYSENQWKKNKDALGILRDNGIPFSPCQGNHDPYVAINKYFPVSDFENQPYWGGSMNGGIENAYYLFEAGGMKFILLTTQWEKSDSVNTWANSVFEQYSSRRAVFVSHSGFSQVKGNAYLVDPIVRKHDNIFLATQGHLCEANGEEYWTTASAGGNMQHLIRTDYQCRDVNDIPAAMLRYYTFKPEENRVYAYTYDIRTQSYETDESSQFSFHYEMKPDTDVENRGQLRDSK